MLFIIFRWEPALWWFWFTDHQKTHTGDLGDMEDELKEMEDDLLDIEDVKLKLKLILAVILIMRA